jgi:hypothetical protein
MATIRNMSEGGRRALTHDEYVAIHHMTQLPESIRKFKAQEYSVIALEQQMQVKLTTLPTLLLHHTMFDMMFLVECCGH